MLKRILKYGFAAICGAVALTVAGLYMIVKNAPQNNISAMNSVCIEFNTVAANEVSELQDQFMATVREPSGDTNAQLAADFLQNQNWETLTEITREFALYAEEGAMISNGCFLPGYWSQMAAAGSMQREFDAMVDWSLDNHANSTNLPGDFWIYYINQRPTIHA